MATHFEVDQSAAAGRAHGRNLPPTFDFDDPAVRAEAQPHELEVIYPDVERYTLSMSFVSFLYVAAGAAMYQSGAYGSRESVDPYFVAGLLMVVAAVATTIVMRVRMKAQLLKLNRRRGLSEPEARKAADKELRSFTD